MRRKMKRGKNITLRLNEVEFDILERLAAVTELSRAEVVGELLIMHGQKEIVKVKKQIEALGAYR